MKFQDRFPLVSKSFEVLLIITAFFLANTNSFVRFRQFPEVDNYSDHEGDFLAAWMLVLVGAFFVLRTRDLLSSFLAAWKRNRFLIIFLAFAVVSVVWSIYVPATIYKFLLLMFSALAASYIGVRYTRYGILDLLSWIGGVFAVLSILVVVYFPFVGIMQNQTFFGSWTGIFWHRNHTGNLFAFFNSIFLFRLLFDDRARTSGKVILFAFYILTAAMVFGSRSATGVIVFLFLHFVVALTAFWLKFNTSIKAWHYYAFAIVLIAGFLVFVTNLGFFFGLLGRSASMTGRVPLWQDLFSRVYLERPILGYGYGALWSLKSFRLEMQFQNNWSHQIYFADNGFFDILLNLGLVGFLLFLAVYISLGVRGFKQAVVTKSWIDFLPLLTFLYILIGNLTYSFLLEVDQFVWMLLVLMVFVTTTNRSNKIAQP